MRYAYTELQLSLCNVFLFISSKYMHGRLKEKFLLFRIWAKKDAAAFGELYDAYVNRIYRFIYFKVPTADIAEDLTSDVFLKAWQYLQEKRDVVSLQALLYRVARSVVIDWYRKTAIERTNVSIDTEMFTEEHCDIGTDKLIKDIQTKMDVEFVLSQLKCLKDEYREVIVMKYLDELSTNEIATALEKTNSNVRVLLHRATKALEEAVHNDKQNTEDNLKQHKK